MAKIDGLFLIPDFLTSEEELSIMNKVDKNVWCTGMRRRVQHYGKRYLYTNVPLDKQLAPVPPVTDSLYSLLERACSALKVCVPPRELCQVIINEYEPGQGISKHVDDTQLFGPVIVCLSLGADTNIIFRKIIGGACVSLHVPSRSIYAMTGESRYNWTHELINSSKMRRISITFRSLLQK